MQQSHPAQPLIVRVIEAPPAQRETLQDVFVGSLAITLIAVITAMAAGGLLAWLLIRWRKRHPPEADHLPPVSPPQALGGGHRSTPAQ